ncbi:MAG: hypothetical protein U1F81_24235 [Verrucomicrobiaceae bacterium]
MVVSAVRGAPLSGTKTIGPTGNYTSIGAAITDIQTQTLGGPLVLELQSTYVSTVETFPLTFTNLGSSAINTLTLRPVAGATGLSISSAATTAATVDLNGASYLTIDGRPGGTGTVSQLTIANTSTSGVALRFINEAASNTIRYTTLRGVNTSASSGVVVFSTTTGAAGNDSNTLDRCDIREGATTPTNAVYGLGTTTTAAQNNSGNTISNCNIFNFYTATSVDSAGVRLEGGNTDWTITGNSFYQTVSRTAAGARVLPIFVNNTSGNNFAITGNFIGGRAPACGGSAWTATGTAFSFFTGIQLNVGTGVPSNVNGNTLQNFVWSSSSGDTTLPGVWSGIYLQAGAANIGSVTGNTIGAGSGTGSVTVTNEGATIGVCSASASTVSIANNTIGSITTNAASFLDASIVGIQVTAGNNTITGNTIGSTTTASSFNAASAATGAQHVTGILSTSGGITSITSNTVANLHNNVDATVTTAQIRGIVASAGTNTITGNTVRNLTTTSRNANATTSHSVYGIFQGSTTAGQTVSQNTVHTLANTAASATVSVTGIYAAASASGTNVVARNWVHSLAVSSTSASSVMKGIYLDAGLFTLQNNMVRVGINAAGSGTAAASLVIGIHDSGVDPGRNVFHNSVYLGGTQTTGASSTYAFVSNGASNARAIQNNLFVNARGNGGGTGKHYAVLYGGTSVNPAGLTAGGNIFLVSGTGGVLGFYNGGDRTTLPAWWAATGQDTTSAVADPLFVNATGSSSAVDLHLQASNPAEGSGLVLAAVTDDFDGQARAGLSPADIGADAGAFSLSNDVFPPAISYLPLPSGTTENRTLTGFATITDNGVVSTGASAPRLYFKKSADADVLGVSNDSTGNGWKYVSATNGSSPYSFVIDYSLINGGGVSRGDVIQYFVAAQDAANNLSSNPAGAGSSGSPPIQNVNVHGTVNSYTIVATPEGTKSIGPTGDYASIGAAVSAIQAVGLSGPLILELQAGYVSTVETFPLVIGNLGTTVSKTVTLRPEPGAVGLIISSASATAATVDLNGAQFLTIDGRAGGMGVASQLTITNTNPSSFASGVALRFINEASNNRVIYTKLTGVNTGANAGVVIFGTTTGTGGNDNNTLDHCDISDGASQPGYTIYGAGTTVSTASNNSGNRIVNCNIFNFRTSGLYLDVGNSDWEIAGNSFYQTTSRAVTAAAVRAIYINNVDGNNFVVSGNFVGGSAAEAGGTAWTTTGTTAAYQFVAIQLNVGTLQPTSVQGNTIKSFIWTSSANDSSPPRLWNGIYIQAGAVNVGTETGNIIGGDTGTDSISVTTSGSGGTVYGIRSESSGGVSIQNNRVGSIRSAGTSTSVAASIMGIQVTAGTNVIASNIIGSPTTANSLNASTSANSFGQQVTGIRSSGTGAVITGNVVSNLNNNDASTSNTAQTIGIATTAGVNTISSNTVRGLSTTSQNANVSNSASVIGIFQFSGSVGQNISQNVVHSLANTSAAAAVWVTGIYHSGATSGANVINGNWVHSLSISSSSVSSRLIGIQFDSGAFNAHNNMVRMGISADGTSTASASVVYGIYDAGIDAGRLFYHNSVYVGGVQTSGASNSCALFNAFGTTNAREFKNNIFVNGRGTSGGTGKHYAVNYGGTGVSPAGLNSDGNIFFTSGVGGILGRYNGADRTSLALWRTATGQDASSAAVDPMFIDATGNSAMVDLHLQASNPAEGGASPIAGITEDFDGQIRSDLTPADIGADAGSFTSSSGDIYPPGISYPTLSSGSTSNRTLTDFASIADNVGVSGGASRPRLYFKKSTDADFFGGNTAADNGWKFVSASNGASPYSFTIDYTLINGGSVSVGNVIQYFVVAQDDSNNLGSNPVGAASFSTPPVQNVNIKPSAGVRSYSIVPSLSGTKTVGSGGDYASLGGAGGLFAAINGSVLTGNLMINIISDLSEVGSNGLNQLNTNDYPPGAATITIQPGSATMKTISGTAANGMIRLNGADRVVIDGRFGGSGRYLTFRNSSTDVFSNTILLLNDATNNTIRNCVIEGATSSFLGVIGLSTGAVTGNDNNLITDNQVRDLSVAAGVPGYLVGSTGSSANVANSNNTIANNELYNFSTVGIRIDGTGNESWTISGNNIYELNPATYPVYGIQFGGGGVNVIAGNYIHDLLTSSSQVYGIGFYGPGVTTIAGNRITDFNGSAGVSSVWGIVASGSAGSTLNVVNNQITLIPSAAMNRSIYGLFDNGPAGSACNVYHNSIVIGGAATANFDSWASLRSSNSSHTARNNVYFNARAGGTGSHFAAGRKGAGGSYTADYNVYVGTGVTPSSLLDYSLTGSSIPVTFAIWQTSTGGDVNSVAGNPGEVFNTAMFVNAAVGDLHIVPGGHPLVSWKGVPVSGVTTDFDGDVRSTTAPWIGADELILPDISVSQAGALTDGVSAVDFGAVAIGGSSVSKTFTITNTGSASLTGLVVSAGGLHASQFTLGTLSRTTVPGGETATFSVLFSPGSSGAKNAVLSIASSVVGAKNPFEINLTGAGQTVYQAWAAQNNVVADPSANGGANLLDFAWARPIGSSRTLEYAGSFAGGGTVAATGAPIVAFETASGQPEFRALFVRRSDHASIGLTYTARFSSDLVTWQNSSVTPTVLADDGLNQIVSVPFPVGGAMFFSLSVTLTP